MSASRSTKQVARRLDDDLPVPPHLRSAVGGAQARASRVPGAARGARLHGGGLARGHGRALVTPVLVQQIFDHGFTGGFRPEFVFSICVLALLLVVLTYVAGARRRAPAGPRQRAGAHGLARQDVRAHPQLSIAEQTEEKRGVFVSRVTADVDTLSQFTEWGGIAWIISIAQVIGDARAHALSTRGS